MMGATKTLSGDEVAQWLTEHGSAASGRLLVVCSGSARLTAGALLEIDLPDGVLVIAKRPNTTAEA